MDKLHVSDIKKYYISENKFQTAAKKFYKKKKIFHSISRKPRKKFAQQLVECLFKLRNYSMWLEQSWSILWLSKVQYAIIQFFMNLFNNELKFTFLVVGQS